MKNKKLLESAKPGAIGQLAKLRHTREQIATNKLSAHERIVSERWNELEEHRQNAQSMSELTQTALQEYERCLHDDSTHVGELQKLSLHVSRLSARLDGKLQLVATAEALWQEACAEKNRLAQKLKLASIKHSQAQTLKVEDRAMTARRRDIRRESEAENTPVQRLSSALFTSTNSRLRGK